MISDTTFGFLLGILSTYAALSIYVEYKMRRDRKAIEQRVATNKILQETRQ